MVGVVAAVVIAATSPLWSATCSSNHALLSVVLLSVGLAGFCLHATLLGMLAGVDRWTQYGVADGDRRRASGSSVAAATFAVGWGLAGLPVGHRRRGGRVADHADRLPGDARGGPAAARPGTR